MKLSTATQRNTARRLAFVLGLLFLISTATTGTANAQTWTYNEITENGDTIVHTYPPPDSLYLHDRIILKFHNGTLNPDSICFDCSDIVQMRAHQKGTQPLTGTDSEQYYWTCLEIVRAQQLSLNIIRDTTLRNTLLSYGGAYLTRMTTATPCEDTLSITRRGDTIPMDHYDWMVLHLDNDTSVVSTLYYLLLAHPSSLDVAGFDIIGHSGSITPCDPEYTAGNQTCLDNIGMPTAWTYSVGSSSIQIAVIDQGINYNLCEMGAGIGTGFHVVAGMDENAPPPPKGNETGGYTPGGIDAHGAPSPLTPYVDANHGTGVASIIAALTNNVGCGTATDWGMAGVAGGWGTDACSGGGKSGTGVSLVGYRAGSGGSVAYDEVEDAILDAVGKSTSPKHPHYGGGVNILNYSNWGGSNSDDPTMRTNIAEAARQGAVFVAIKGNGYSSDRSYPSDYDPMKDIIAVGASNVGNYAWESYSNTNDYVDILAPGGDPTGPSQIEMLQSDASGNETLGWDYGTSFAAPQVSGVLGLMMSYYPSIPNSVTPYTEDWEGMLESSANNAEGSVDYTTKIGWGFLRADKMFTMLDPNIGTYRLFHYTITGSNLETPADWDALDWQTGTNAVTLDDIDYTGSLGSGKYEYKVREIKGSIHYASSIDRTTKEVYVWGTGGGSSSAMQYGWMPGNTVVEEPWAEVTDAEGGDGTYPKINRPGIRHGFSDFVHAHTYQYRITTDGGTTWTDFPQDADLGINVTVFGSSSVPAGVKAFEKEDGNLSVYPSIASSVMSVHSSSTERGVFEVFDILGRTVMEQNVTAGHGDFQIETGNFTDGFYTCLLETPTKSHTAKFLVRH